MQFPAGCFLPQRRLAPQEGAKSKPGCSPITRKDLSAVERFATKELPNSLAGRSDWPSKTIKSSWHSGEEPTEVLLANAIADAEPIASVAAIRLDLITAADVAVA